MDEARGTLGERGWRTRKGDPASYDDISVFVIPLYKHKNITEYIRDDKHVPLHLREDSFVKKYVKRGEVEVRTTRPLSKELNANRDEAEPSQCDNAAKLEEEAVDSENTNISDKEVS